MAGNEVVITVRAQDQASQTIDKIEKKASAFGSTMQKVGAVAGGFLAANVVAGAAEKVTSFIGTSISLASDLREVTSKNQAVFKDSAAAVERWAAGAARDFGQSKRQALDAASGFGNMFDQLGIGSDKAADMSMGITELASDFASFHNADITEVLNAQSAAFRGEYDSLQKFLPLINAAAVEQKAMEQTGKESAKALTAQEKALATYTLMLEGAGQAQGDFDKTAQGNANAARIQQAAMEDLQATIGDKLALVDVLVQKVIPTLETLYAKHWPAVQESIDKVVGFIRQHWGTISAVFEAVKTQVVAQIEGMIKSFEGVVSLVTHVVDGVSALVHGRWGEAWTAFKQIPEDLINIFLGQVQARLGVLPEVLFGLGKDAVQGFINGLESMAGAVARKAADLADTATFGLAGKLGIKSPSRVFHQLGVMTMKGYADGITDGYSQHVAGAMDGVAASASRSITDAVMSIWSGKDPGRWLGYGDINDWRSWSGTDQGQLLKPGTNPSGGGDGGGTTGSSSSGGWTPQGIIRSRPGVTVFGNVVINNGVAAKGKGAELLMASLA